MPSTNEEKTVFAPPDLQVSAHFGLITGTVDDINLDTSFSLLENYSDSVGAGAFFTLLDPLAGQITTPVEAIYQLTAKILGSKSAAAPNQMIQLFLRLSNAGGNDGDHLADTLQLGSPMADDFAMQTEFAIRLPKDAVAELRLQGSTNFGNATFQRVLFRLSFLNLGDS